MHAHVHVCSVLDMLRNKKIKIDTANFPWNTTCTRVPLKFNRGFKIILNILGLVRDLNPGPLAPKARIIPLDH